MREHDVPDNMVAIARFEQDKWSLYREYARSARLLVLDNLTGALGSNKIGDDDAARKLTEPLNDIAELGTTVLMIAHSAKNFEAQSGRYTPTGVMGSTVYQAWERLNIHIHDVTEPATRSMTIKSNDYADHKLLVEAKWGRASAEWRLLSNVEDTRQRTDETYQRRNELADRIVGDPELASLSQRKIADKLGETFSTVQRSLKAAGAVQVRGVWVIPADEK